MISFVWSSKYPFLAGAGGSENYTAGQIRELQRRGIKTRIITIGHGEQDDKEGFPDIEFLALSSKHELSELDDTLVFITYPLDVPTRHPAYVILHCPPPSYAYDPLYNPLAFRSKKLITPSKFSARMWRNYLGLPWARIPAVYPFAENVFRQVVRPQRKDKIHKILFAGRLTPDKGIYTLLAALHMPQLQGMEFELTATSAGNHSPEGAIIQKLLEAHPLVNVVPAQRTPKAMAQLMAEHDVVVMPSTDIFWREAFGIVSVEAQHAGCRVVASRSGGLPETNCGGLLLTEPDNPQALARTMAKAIQLGPLTYGERLQASQFFTVEASVDALLKVVLPQKTTVKQRVRLPGDANLLPRLSPQLTLFEDRWKQSAYLSAPVTGNEQLRP